MPSYQLTFLDDTFLWDTNATTGIVDPYPSEESAVAGGPYTVAPVIIPFDPIHRTGGSFWFLTSGPYIGLNVSQHTNDLGYGSILVETTGVGGGPISQTHINPKAPWRLLIKGMGGDTGFLGKNQLTFNSDTDLWSRTTTGIINYDYSIANLQGVGTGGPYAVNPIVVPYDPEHATGGSFWRLLEGPYTGYLVSRWTNELGYGDITVVQEEGFDRGPGDVIATFGPGDIVPTLPTGTGDKKAHSVGASILYNAAGEMHFTLLDDHPLVRVPVPKQTHYAIEFWNVDTEEWDEVFAGLVWDYDATDTEVVFYGIDYLALYRYTIDERFDLNFSEKSAPIGSKYVDRTITDIITAHLEYSQSRPDSLVGFIAIGDIAAMVEKVTIYSTFQDSLSFIGGLIESHRAGTGKQTRMKVIKIAGVYTFIIEDDPGVVRDHLALEYGDLAQGYRVVPFGESWASRVNFIARNPKGERLKIVSDSSAVDQGVWGRIGQAPSIVEVIDTNDLRRRALQAAIDASRLGRQIGIGLKLGSFRPLEGYDITDEVPVVIDHGAVTTQDWGNDDFAIDEPEDPSVVMASYWSILGIEWESYDDSHWMTNLILFPRGRRPVASAFEVIQSTTDLEDSGFEHWVWPEQPTGGGTKKISALAQRAVAPFVGIAPIGSTLAGDPDGYIAGTEYTYIGGTNTNDVSGSRPGYPISMAFRDTEPGEPIADEWPNIGGRPRSHSIEVSGLPSGPPDVVVVQGSMDVNVSNYLSPEITITEPGYIFFIQGYNCTGPSDGFSSSFSFETATETVENGTIMSQGFQYGSFGGHSVFGYFHAAAAGVYQIDLSRVGPSPRAGDYESWVLAFWPGSLGVPVPSTSDPMVPRTPLGVGHGPPATSTNPGNTQYYVDLDTGQVYIWDDDAEIWSPLGPPSTWSQTSAHPTGIFGLDGYDGAEGPQGPQGPRGADGADGANGMVPYLIESGETFTVPTKKQALFNIAITVDAGGSLVVDGFLLMVT